MNAPPTHTGIDRVLHVAIHVNTLRASTYKSIESEPLAATVVKSSNVLPGYEAYTVPLKLAVAPGTTPVIRLGNVPRVAYCATWELNAEGDFYIIGRGLDAEPGPIVATIRYQSPCWVDYFTDKCKREEHGSP